jgi:multiple sugar transport system permease protein
MERGACDHRECATCHAALDQHYREAVPVTVGAAFFFAAAGGGVRWGVAAALMILSTLPPVLLGLVMYRHVGRSLMVGAVKS